MNMHEVKRCITCWSRVVFWSCVTYIHTCKSIYGGQIRTYAYGARCHGHTCLLHVCVRLGLAHVCVDHEMVQTRFDLV